jgi:hypothetical protein
VSAAPIGRRSQSATDLENGSLAQLNLVPWLPSLGATDVGPASKGRDGGHRH